MGTKDDDSRLLRLNQALSRLGIASRRRADELIRAGRVAVNGKVATDFSTRVNLVKDRITIDGKPVGVQFMKPPPTKRAGTLLKHLYSAFYKPKGVISTWSDERGRKCLADYFGTRQALITVGRLDRRSEGLMIITSDGELANRLMHPRYQVPRTYEILASPPVTEALFALIVEGFNVAPKVSNSYEVSSDRQKPVRKEQTIFFFKPKNTRILEERSDATLLELTLTTGRYREIRRAMEALGLTVLRLKRTAYGVVKLGSLKSGGIRKLTKSEIKALQGLIPVED